MVDAFIWLVFYFWCIIMFSYFDVHDFSCIHFHENYVFIYSSTNDALSGNLNVCPIKKCKTSTCKHNFFFFENSLNWTWMHIKILQFKTNQQIYNSTTNRIRCWLVYVNRVFFLMEIWHPETFHWSLVWWKDENVLGL